MYTTGPGVVFDGWVNLDNGTQGSTHETQNFSILIKREGATNLGHLPTEIFSIMLTIDVLQMGQPSKELPAYYIPSRDAANTQLVILKPSGWATLCDVVPFRKETSRPAAGYLTKYHI
ncbi:hypothetical protein N7539_006886 [Penicillium diatomitis]|uniref:Uncharacterized protein n=1 Tax=Penicillium diatomitis TaxID=2819901 RepID=A0A9W9X2K8_9EURO|nr:uncharacterized protein N7539_006886 [Penicillium diatomitis]KAJ5480992.1 hypothetical protein N7539_006886 [Penicillium diatomitis]